jgi:hydroxyacylglutathione hydrolase
MERLNLEGPPLLGGLPVTAPMSAAVFASQVESAIVVDTRMELGFGAAHVPGALSIWLGGLPGYAGWVLPFDRPLLLVQDGEDPASVVRCLIRMGYNAPAGYLAGGMLAWHTAGYESRTVRMITVSSLCTRLDEGEKAWILDVRSEDELESHGTISGAHHIHVPLLPDRLDEVPKDRTVYIFCASGVRSMIAASLLKQAGRRNVVVVLGGLIGWNSTTCPIV